MKVLIPVLFLLYFLSACGSEEKSFIAEEQNVVTIKEFEETLPQLYYSKIRNEDSVKVGEIYFDTLTFLSFDSNYDYWFGLFLTKKQDTVSLVFHDIIEENNRGIEMVLQWEVDSLYEAGECDELYYQGRIIVYDVIRDLEKGFEKYLQQFVIDFVNPNTTMLQYLNSELGFQSSFNIGLYCTLDKLDSVDKHDWFTGFDVAIFEGAPEGHFCDGYPNVQNGFYYQRVLLKDLPTFDKMDGEEFTEEKYNVPVVYMESELMKATIIKEQYHQGYLYFIQIENKWYFFAQDLCDCSA